jgi:hypothetical protein
MTYTVLNTDTNERVIVRIDQLRKILSTIAHAISTAMNVDQHRQSRGVGRRVDVEKQAVFVDWRGQHSADLASAKTVRACGAEYIRV